MKFLELIRPRGRRLFRTVLEASAGVAIFVLASVPAEAQFFGGTYGGQVIASVPANLTNAVAFTPTIVGINVPNGRNIAFQLTSAGSNTTSSAVSAVFFASLDGVTFDTSTPYVLTLTLANTAQVTTSTNWDIGAKGYLGLAYITNANAFFATNTVLRYAIKPGY